ncbi:unnamed protein product, partial [Rotaria sp. Silwood2]
MDDDEGESFTDEEIKEESLAFIFAGNVCEEVDQVLPNRITPTNEHLSELVVCAAVINETLRLYPPAPLLVRHYEMTLSVDKRYEIIFLSRHPMGPQLGVKAVAKAIKCAKSTVQYWLNRWKESKDLSDSKRIGRPRSTTKKVDQRISDLASTDNIATTRDIQRVLNLPISKPLLTEKHLQKRLEWAHAAGDMNWNRIIFSDETTVRLSQLKRCVWNLPGKRKVFRT